MSRKIICLLAASVVALSCQDRIDGVSSEPAMKEVRIEVAVGRETDSKTSVSSTTGYMSFRYGDKLSVLASDNRFYTFVCSDPSSVREDDNAGSESLYDEVLWSDIVSGVHSPETAVFKGMIPEDAMIGGTAFTVSENADGVDNTVYSSGVLTYTYPSEYEWKAETSVVPMAASFKAGAQAICLRQTGAVLRLNVKNPQAGTKVVFTFPENRVTGAFDIDLGEEFPSATAASGSSVVSCNIGYSIPSAVVDIPVPAGTVGSFNVEIFDPKGNSVYTKTHTGPYGFARASLVIVGEVVLNEPPKDDVVQFAVPDPNMQISLPKPSKATGMAVVTCPGGGYNSHSMTYEGTVWHDFMNNLGIANIVLKYKLPKGNPQTTISDVEAAFAYIREHSEEWGIDPDKIGIMGFSAGGHIASTIATHSEAASPAFQILFYPVITMEASGTHTVTMQNFLGSSPSADLVTLYSNEKQVTRTTPQCFLTYTRNDQLVPYLTNGKAYYDALVEAGVPVMLKDYESTSWPSNGHGWAGYDKFPYKADVEAALAGWLGSLKWN